MDWQTEMNEDKTQTGRDKTQQGEKKRLTREPLFFKRTPGDVAPARLPDRTPVSGRLILDEPHCDSQYSALPLRHPDLGLVGLP